LIFPPPAFALRVHFIIALASQYLASKSSRHFSEHRTFLTTPFRREIRNGCPSIIRSPHSLHFRFRLEISFTKLALLPSKAINPPSLQTTPPALRAFRLWETSDKEIDGAKQLCSSIASAAVAAVGFGLENQEL
jgi:hypothetical protein